MKKDILLFMALGLLFFSCASKPAFEGCGDLCGLVIDENNYPVKDFIVYCEASEKGWFSGNDIQPVLTNESGLFVFPSLPSGDYFISGEKNNYLRIEQVVYRFNNRTNILCLQTKTFKEALLKSEELLSLGQNKAAIELLDKISFEKKSYQQELVYFFKFFALERKEEKRELLVEIQNISVSKASSDFSKSFTAKLEEVIK